MLEGPAKVSVDEAGDVIVEMTPEPYSLQTVHPFPIGLVRFLGATISCRTWEAGLLGLTSRRKTLV
jgi:hypothetical protein